MLFEMQIFFSHDHLSLLCMILPIFPSRTQQMNILYVCLSICLKMRLSKFCSLDDSRQDRSYPTRFSNRYTPPTKLCPQSQQKHMGTFLTCVHIRVLQSKK